MQVLWPFVVLKKHEHILPAAIGMFAAYASGLMSEDGVIAGHLSVQQRRLCHEQNVHQLAHAGRPCKTPRPLTRLKYSEQDLHVLKAEQSMGTFWCHHSSMPHHMCTGILNKVRISECSFN